MYFFQVVIYSRKATALLLLYRKHFKIRLSNFRIFFIWWLQPQWSIYSLEFSFSANSIHLKLLFQSNQIQFCWNFVIFFHFIESHNKCSFIEERNTLYSLISMSADLLIYIQTVRLFSFHLILYICDQNYIY